MNFSGQPIQNMGDNDPHPAARVEPHPILEYTGRVLKIENIERDDRRPFQ